MARKGKEVTDGARIVVLKSDLPGEDGPYTIGAVWVPEGEKLETFERKARRIMDRIRKEEEYEDNDLLVALEEKGYELAEAPEEIVVRD